MGNQPSSSKRRGSREPRTTAEQAAERAKRVVGDLQEGIKNSVKKLDDDHPAAQLLDHVCGTYYHEDDKYRNSRSASYYSEEASEDGSRTFQSEDDTTYDGRRGRKSDKSVDSQSFVTHSDYDSDSRRRGRTSFDTEDESRVTYETEPKLISKPLASSFAKRCYFTKSGIGKTTQHYEGLTLTGNVVLMLASAMKLKGCPTICDEDLRRVEQTYPNQFSRLPDELLLSSGWRRISKYCHFSNKSIPDGIPFFHSKQRLHLSGGYYFLLAASVGMIRPIDVETLTKDTLVLLETDFPNQCDATPSVLITDPAQWVLVNKFCFFSGGPINTEEDVYYQADFDGNPIFMLAFLSPSLTPEELYKLTESGLENEPGLKSVADVQEVESVYDLTERDFDDLKLYHLGPCRALPQYILQPSAWTKVLPPHFLAARQQAMLRAQDYDERFDEVPALKPMYDSETLQKMESEVGKTLSTDTPASEHPFEACESSAFIGDSSNLGNSGKVIHTDAEQEGAFHRTILVEGNMAVTNQEYISPGEHIIPTREINGVNTSQIDPPDDEPPSLKIGSMEENESMSPHRVPSTSSKLDIDDQGFFRLDPTSKGSGNLSSKHVSPVPESRHNHQFQNAFQADEFENHFEDVTDIGANGSEGLIQNYSDEKKMGIEKDEADSDLNYSKEGGDEELGKSDRSSSHAQPYNDIEPIETSYTRPAEYEENPSPLPVSPAGVSTSSVTDSMGRQSPAMRGAHEILKQNRRRRAESSNKSFVRKFENQTASPIKIDNPGSTRSEMSTNTSDENGTDIIGSAISGSSILSDNSGTSDRSSRRALILQMAKARMKNNRESPAKTPSSVIHEDDPDDTVFTHATVATHDFDLTGDLD